MTTTRPRRPTYHPAPFGHPDGANGNLHDVQSAFVDFAGSGAVGGLASRADDRSVRVLVGKKGVGKTIYLRRYQASANDEESVFACEREVDPPATEDVVRITQLYDASTVTETWSLIWRRAIQRSVLSRLLCERRLSELLEQEVAAHLREDFGDLVPLCRTPRTVYAELADIVQQGYTPHRLNDYLKQRTWAELEHWLSRALAHAPPIYIFIDAVDEHFQRAPMYWLKCQKGLLLQVMTMLQGEIGARLHVVVGIRDLVLSSVLRGEHASRFRQSTHIRVLEWDHQSIRYFLEAKLERLDRDLLVRPRRPGLEGWLGVTTIENRARGVVENAEDYLLRHTRLIPRDVVVLGNAVCEQTAQAVARGDEALSPGLLRRTVAQVARGLADEQIRICANQIAADQIPAHGGRQGLTEYFVGSHEYSDGLATTLMEILGELGCDRFDHATIRRIEERGKRRLDGYEHILDVLWQNGILGYDSPEPGAQHAHFYDTGEADEFHLPADKASYVVHPCVPHLIRMEHIGQTPVRGFRYA